MLPLILLQIKKKKRIKHLKVAVCQKRKITTTMVNARVKIGNPKVEAKTIMAGTDIMVKTEEREGPPEGLMEVVIDEVFTEMIAEVEMETEVEMEAELKMDAKVEMEAEVEMDAKVEMVIETIEEMDTEIIIMADEMVIEIIIMDEEMDTKIGMVIEIIIMAEEMDIEIMVLELAEIMVEMVIGMVDAIMVAVREEMVISIEIIIGPNGNHGLAVLVKSIMKLQMFNVKHVGRDLNLVI